LVALAYIPNPHNYPVVNHIDGDKLNNCVDNLEWCSASHNAQDAEKRGKVYSLEKPRGRRKTKEEAIEIYNYILNNLSMNNTQLALKLDTSRTTIKYYKNKILSLNDYHESEYNQVVGNCKPLTI
jgi:DNA-binding NarL/FixJ family response regulator